MGDGCSGLFKWGSEKRLGLWMFVMRARVNVTNSGTSSFTVRNIRVNGEMTDLTDWSSGSSDTVAPGDSETFTITHTVLPGSKYAVSLYDIDGTLVGADISTA
jgi:P pilus assembly chaperone PapD